MKGRESHILVVSSIKKIRKEVRSMKWFSSYRNPDGRENETAIEKATPKSKGWSHKPMPKPFQALTEGGGIKSLCTRIC